MPVLKSERPYGFKDYTHVITGFACGMVLHYGRNSRSVCGREDCPDSLHCGNIVAVLLMSLTSQVVSSKYGVDAYTASRSVLGDKGTKVFLIIDVDFCHCLADYSFCMMVAKAVGNIVPGFTGIDITTGFPVLILSLLAGAICWVVA